jgi:hypothetical protein
MRHGKTGAVRLKTILLKSGAFFAPGARPAGTPAAGPRFGAIRAERTLQTPKPVQIVFLALVAHAKKKQDLPDAFRRRRFGAPALHVSECQDLAHGSFALAPSPRQMMRRHQPALKPFPIRSHRIGAPVSRLQAFS